MMQQPRNELKTGKRPVIQQMRTFKEGETLFAENSAGRELFIIQRGSVAVYKDGPDGRVELAQIEAGGIVGEMSLLDTLPRSATVVAREAVEAVVIGHTRFQAVMQQVPLWLQSIIKIIVSRLRDANRRVDNSLLRNKLRGFCALLRLLVPVYHRQIDGRLSLSVDTLLVEAWYICRLRKRETDQLLAALEQRSIITIFTHEEQRFVAISDPEALALYEEYLVLKDANQAFKELTIPEAAVSMLSNIVYVAQKLGRETDEGTSLSKRALADDLTGNDAAGLEKNLLDLRRRNLINMMPVENDVDIIFRKDTLTRIKKIREWMPRFSMETP